MQAQERDAINTLRGGDIRGLETLVRLYGLTATRTAYAITGDLALAEDIAADAFITVHSRIKSYDPSRPFAPWLYRIVVNGSLKAARRARRDQRGDDDWDWLQSRISPAPGPEDEALGRELRELVLTAVYALPPRQRAALVLRYYLDMDEATIARTLGCPLGTVKWRLHAAKARLRQSLTPLMASDD
jgi:RNA polymerase sigma-70 factor, ECF subfamily